MKNRPVDDFIQSFMRQLEKYSPTLLRTFRKNLSETLTDREASQKGHLKADPLMEMLDISKFQAWLQDKGIHERAPRIIWQGLMNRSSDELTRMIRNATYADDASKDLIDFLLSAGVAEEDASTFIHITEEMDVSVPELIQLVFRINFRAENAVREEALRGSMTLKEMVSLYIYTALQVALSEYGLQEDIIAEISNRLALCNNMKRQFMVVQQIERFFFGASSTDEFKTKTRNDWIKQINDFELKIALEQYVLQEKLATSDMELAEIYSEAHHIFDDVSDIKDETLAVISITYRLDNPEETGHTVEELLAMIDQIKLLTLEFGPLNILTRDVFQFFEILGESDHHNHLFRQTILTFRRQLKRIGEQTRKMGERVTLNHMILAYLYSRLDAYLEDYEGDKASLLEGIRDRLAHCHDSHRQFAIVDLIERHLFANPGLIQIVDESYWTELINTFELNIILEIYIEQEYLFGGAQALSKNQILDRIQSHINNISDIAVKSLTVVFITAQLSAILEQSKKR
ncbi:MAG: hypothetical protein KDC45_10890, partial [Bacteroidetes bacterium]|nr:hypothetical protein [Bacteroidota bacterium]